MSAPRVSAVVRCLNEERHLGRLLSGLAQQTIRPGEVIVVDSGSSDATVSIAAQQGARIVTVRREEFSFGSALNRGCAAACGDVLLIASAHVYPLYTDWIERLLNPFADTRVGMVYGRQRGAPTTKYSEHQVFSHWFPAESTASQAHPFCNNANAAVRRALWERFRYDETLTGLEDVDLARRLMAAGHRLAYAADAEIVHVHDETLRQIFTRYRREAIALGRIDPHTRVRFVDFVRLFASNVVSDYFHARHDGCLRGNVLGIPAFRLMQFWGTYLGARQRGGVPDALKQAFYYPRPRRRHTPAQPRDADRQPVDYSADRRETARG